MESEEPLRSTTIRLRFIYMHIIVILALILSALSPLNVYAENDRTPKLTVRVLEDKLSGTIPLQGASVLLDGRWIGNTDRNGELVIQDKRLNRSPRLEVKKEGYSLYNESAVWNDNGNVDNELTVKLFKTHKLRKKQSNHQLTSHP